MNVVVLGAGAWGTAIAIYMARLGHNVSLVTRRLEHAVELCANAENQAYLPGVALPKNLQVTHSLAMAMAKPVHCIFLACPSIAVQAWCERLQKVLTADKDLSLMIITLCKGLTPQTLASPLNIVNEAFPFVERGVLSGPTYAQEVARGQPTAVVLGVAEMTERTQAFQHAIHGKAMRVYLSLDWRGVELGGCLKNIYAIAAGICDGLKLGDNTKSALLARSLQEIMTIGQALGGDKETFLGLSGLGDLMATSFGQWSRNRMFGEQIGRGIGIEELLSDRRTVVEGYHTTLCFNQHRLLQNWDIPILDEVYQILYEGKSPKNALTGLLARAPKLEFLV